MSLATLGTFTCAIAAQAAPDPQLTLSPSAAYPNDRVSIYGFGSEDVTDGSCLVYLQQVLIDDASCAIYQDGSFKGEFVVPASAPEGANEVAVCWSTCSFNENGEPYWEANATLETLPAPPPAGYVEVPVLRCGTEDTARSTLKRALLNGERRSGDAGVVLGQSPAAGEFVPEQTTVLYDLQSAGQTTVPVPPLLGFSLLDAQSQLSAVCLVMDVASQDPAGTVVAQSIPAGTPVQPGTAVVVRVVPPTSPPTPTRLSPTSSTTTNIGPPTPSTPSSPSVGPTSPTNTSSLGTGGDPSSGAFPPSTGDLLVILVAVAVAVLAVATGWVRLARPQLQVRWVGQHVTVAPLPIPSAPPAVVRDKHEPPGRHHRFTFLPHRGTRSMNIKEDPT